MARFDTSFNFGANKRKPKKGKGKAKKDGSKSNAWQAYVGCGAGCRHMRFPPFLLNRHFAELSGKSGWEVYPPSEDDATWEAMPAGLRGELRAGWERIPDDDEDRPCVWLQSDGTCRHYEHRPKVCREAIEPGDDGCRTFLRRWGMDGDRRR